MKKTKEEIWDKNHKHERTHSFSVTAGGFVERQQSVESEREKGLRSMQEYHDQFIPTPYDLEAMAMKEFPVKMESIRNIRGYFDVDKNIEPRDIFLSGLQAYHKMMGGQEG